MCGENQRNRTKEQSDRHNETQQGQIPRQHQKNVVMHSAINTQKPSTMPEYHTPYAVSFLKTHKHIHTCLKQITPTQHITTRMLSAVYNTEQEWLYCKYKKSEIAFNCSGLGHSKETLLQQFRDLSPVMTSSTSQNTYLNTLSIPTNSLLNGA